MIGVVEPLAAQPPRDREAVEPRHRDVEHDRVRHRALDLDQRRASVGRRAHLQALGAERAREHPADGCVVVDDEDRVGFDIASQRNPGRRARAVREAAPAPAAWSGRGGRKGGMRRSELG